MSEIKFEKQIPMADTVQLELWLLRDQMIKATAAGLTPIGVTVGVRILNELIIRSDGICNPLAKEQNKLFGLRIIPDHQEPDTMQLTFKEFMVDRDTDLVIEN